MLFGLSHHFSQHISSKITSLINIILEERLSMHRNIYALKKCLPFQFYQISRTGAESNNFACECFANIYNDFMWHPIEEFLFYDCFGFIWFSISGKVQLFYLCAVHSEQTRVVSEFFCTLCTVFFPIRFGRNCATWVKE